MAAGVGSVLARAGMVAAAIVALIGCETPTAGIVERAEGVPPDLAIEISNLEPPVRAQFETAIAAVHSAKQSAASHTRLAMLLHAYGQPQRAAEYYSQALEIDPASARLTYLLGVALEQAGDGSEAVAKLKRCVSLSPDNQAPYLRLAELLAKSGKTEESRAMYGAVLAKGADPTARFGLGQLALAEGDTRSAVRHLRAACRLLPRLRKARYALAQAYRLLGEPAKAADELNRFHALQSGVRSYDDPWMNDVDALRIGSFEHHFRMGKRHQDAGRIEAALKQYLRAAEIDSMAARVHVNLVAAYGSLEDVVGARRHYQAALKIDPDIEELHYNYGVLLTRRRDFAAAARAFRRALEINPGSGEAHNNLGYVFEQTGRLEEAVREYEAAIATQPNYSLPHVHLARLHLAAARYTKAVTHLEEAVRFEKKQDAHLRYLLALAYAEQGESDAAFREAAEARRLATVQGSGEVLRMIDARFPPRP